MPTIYKNDALILKEAVKEHEERAKRSCIYDLVIGIPFEDLCKIFQFEETDPNSEGCIAELHNQFTKASRIEEIKSLRERNVIKYTAKITI